jgi:hypothetical protein
MFNLYQIVSDAQGGQGLDNLAKQFGISRDQADTAVKSLLPALSSAFMAKAAQPGGLHEIAGAMSDDQHRQAYSDPTAAQDPSTQQKGGTVAGSVFGNNAMVQQVIEQASKYSGIPAATLQQMLPVVISLVLGGVTAAMRNQGLGGMLGQLASGGLGNILGQFGGAAGQPGAAAGGSFGGMMGTILGGLFGGAAQHPADQPAPTNPSATSPGAAPAPGGAGLPPAMQAGMEALSKMFQPGVPSHPGQGSDLGDEISSILGGKKS